MKHGRKYLTVAVGVAAVGAGVAAANGGDDGGDDGNQGPITGNELEQAVDAALEHVGGGEVTGTEVGDEESYYEVEVTRADGSQVDVQLDESFAVVGVEGEGSEDDD